MPAIVTVLYPRGGTFDMDYYLATHMPLVQRLWAPHGLQKWTVIQFPDSAPYAVQATLEWGSVAEIQAAQGGDAAKEIMGDIKNFANPAEPVLMGGAVVGSATS